MKKSSFSALGATLTYNPCRHTFAINDPGIKLAKSEELGMCFLNNHNILKLKVNIDSSGSVTLSNPTLSGAVKVASGTKIKGDFIYLCMQCNHYCWSKKE